MSENKNVVDAAVEQETKEKKSLFPKKEKAPKAPKEKKVKEKVVKEKKVKEKAPKEKKVKEKTGKEKVVKEKKSVQDKLVEVKKAFSKINLPKIPAFGDKSKDTQPKKESANQNGKQPRFLLFSIRNKIVLCFVIPMIFMIIIGVSAYNKAAEGISQKYQDSAFQTIKMATDYVDMSCSFIEAEGTKYAQDYDLGKYYLGLYEDDPTAKMTLLSNVKTDITTSQESNPFISNIHIVTKSIVPMITTQSASTVEGCFETYRESVALSKKHVIEWIDSHPVLDEHLGMNQDDYILSYETLSQAQTACIVIDIKRSAIEEFLQDLDMGEESIVGFITENGREIICETLPEGKESKLVEGESVFFGQDFFNEIGVAAEGEEVVLEGIKNVKYNGEECLFLYSRSEETSCTICALVPIDVITSQAGEIKNMTVWLVLLSSVFVLIVGVLTVTGIQANMRRISKKFGEVAKGDLTVQVTAKGNDEFRGLAASATHMIENTKKLVNKVSNATDELESSAKDVNKASNVIDEYSRDITQAISEINEGMTRQSKHAQECVNKTDILSDEIQEVGRVVERVEKLVDETEGMINKGMEIIQVLGERAVETTDITVKVGESIDALRKESQNINSFVETITDISEQTNLLSLNASIEAARAGEAGRGFAVVAEEIRKLADDSAKAAGKIRTNVEHISAQTMNSVESANQARSMVDLQSKAVEEVIAVFREMQVRMNQLVDGLKDIVVSIDRADGERSATVAAVKNISDIIEETAGSAETVNEVANKLLENVENLNRTAEVLGENMDGLKNEISVFKI